ncbi:MAG: isocitrate/isopropylmalate dehydrogenase family protein [Planctomycetota bacterium]
MHQVTLIPGDGTGPEIAEAARMLVEAAGVAVNWDVQSAGLATMETEGTPLPDRVLDSIRRTGVALKAPITTPVGTGFRSVNVALRQTLDLYACLRPCKVYKGVRSRYENVDLVVVRENTEDLYAGIEFARGADSTRKLLAALEELQSKVIREDSAVSIKPISEYASRRIVTFAFEYARSAKRRKVTAVHKANIMKYSDGLFLETARAVASSYGDVEFEDRIVDNMCMQLVQRPEAYDVLVMPNLYGDIVSDLCAGLVGGLGVAPGANIGDRCAVFEATHGSAPKYTGLNKVNPTALVLSAALMLRHIGEKDAANRLEAAVAEVIAEGKHVTYDLKANRDDACAVGTREMAQAIARRLR